MRIRSDKTISKIDNGIANCEPFQAASVSGDFISYIPSNSWQGEEDRQRLDDAIRNSSTNKVFAVFSYGTPIAWKAPNSDWFVTPEKYTASTTHHTTLIHSAIAKASK